ncbi:MAG: nucleotide exchange factor GrpE [Gammaproteobacteria bacterium]|nr:nucleotide exchange factor GrpE [Gammaproteobacteria bacterium]
MAKQKKSDTEDSPEVTSEGSDTEEVDSHSQSTNTTESDQEAASSEAEEPSVSVDVEIQDEADAESLEPTEIELLKAEVNELTSKLIDLEGQLAESQREVSYAKAETQTVTRRGREDMTRAVNRARRDLLTRLMLVADTFHQTANELEKIEKDERTDVVVTAIQMAIKEFDKVLIGEGLELSNPIGDEFDPQFHEAQAIVPSETEAPGTIIDVLRVGYLLDGSVLRAAQVVVAKEVPTQENEAADDA